MVEVIAIHADLASEELGKATLDERVMAAMRRVPRHLFVPAPLAPHAYHDMPLPIGFDKTISQPFIVALMTDLLAPEPHEAVLEIGTGLGYQTAILAELAGQVWSVEIIEEFASHAEALLQQLGSSNVGIRVGDGSRGWAEHAPYRQDPGHGGGRATAAGSARAAQARGAPGHAGGTGRSTAADCHRQGCGRRTRARELIPVRFSRLETVM